MIATTSIHDIVDAESFVAATIERSRVHLTRDEHDELLAEGLCILTELAKQFVPHMPGYPTAGRFSGYAARYLPRRLQDAHRRLHPEHIVTRDPNGKRHTTYNPPALSIFHEDMPQLPATQAIIDQPDKYETINQAIQRLDHHDQAHAHELVMLINDGYGVDHIARTLGLRRRQVTQLRGTVATALASLRKAA